MIAAERYARVVHEVRQVGLVSTEALSRTPAVSSEMIRRDLMSLERQGPLSRVLGGAAASTPTQVGEETSSAERAGVESDAKNRVGRVAASLVRPGKAVVLRVGTTAQRVARHLDEVKVRRRLIRNAEPSFVPADATTFDQVARYRATGLDAVSGLITDQEPSAALRAAVTGSGGEVLIA